MKVQDDNLFTPIYVKTRTDMPWPDDEKAFYLLSASGLFLCRNHAFFQSCVPVRNWPSELARHEASLRLRYPKVPRRLFERVVGFFARIGELYGSEAGVILAWNKATQRVELIVPAQKATVSRSSWSGKVYPIGLHYQAPTDLPADLVVFGDIHSHVDEPAYASGTDKWDEAHRAGLHIVVGRINREPPEIHIEAVVDGTRFPVDPEQVIAGYRHRRTHVPQEWIDKVTVDPPPPKDPPPVREHNVTTNRTHMTGYGTYFSGPGTGYSSRYQRDEDTRARDTYFSRPADSPDGERDAPDGRQEDKS